MEDGEGPPDVTLIPAAEIGQWLLAKNHLLSAYELLFELEDSRDAADPTEPQARTQLRDFFKDKSRFPQSEMAAVNTQDGARCRAVGNQLPRFFVNALRAGQAD